VKRSPVFVETKQTETELGGQAQTVGCFTLKSRHEISEVDLWWRGGKTVSRLASSTATSICFESERMACLRKAVTYRKAVNVRKLEKSCQIKESCQREET